MYESELLQTASYRTLFIYVLFFLVTVDVEGV